MTSTHPNWVVARANCTLDDNLTAIMGQVRADMRTFNELRPDKRGTRQFRASHDNGEFVVKRMAEVNDHRGTHVVEDTACNSDVVTPSLHRDRDFRAPQGPAELRDRAPLEPGVADMRVAGRWASSSSVARQRDDHR